MLTVVEDASAVETGWARRRVAHTRWTGEPTRDELRAMVKAVDDDGLVVCGTAATLNLVVEALRRAGRVSDTPVTFLPGRPPGRGGVETYELTELLALPADVDAALSADPVELPLARNDIGGVLLLEAGLAPASGKSFGAQAYHDDLLIADGPVARFDIRVDYSADDVLRATVTPPSGRKRLAGSTGRAVQIACHPARMSVDGRDLGEVEGRTWYLDDREHWLLRGAQRPAAALPEAGPRRGWLSRLLSR
jgi:hypothetical protein